MKDLQERFERLDRKRIALVEKIQRAKGTRDALLQELKKLGVEPEDLEKEIASRKKIVAASKIKIERELDRLEKTIEEAGE